MSRWVRPAALPLLVIAVAFAACDHGNAFSAAEPGPNPPPVPPQRLTFSLESDGWPTWLPDGSGIAYSYRVPERTDKDRCLAVLPASGAGRIDQMVCVRGQRELDTANTVSAHGISADGRLAVVVETGAPRFNFPAFRHLYLGRADGGTLRAAMSFPYTTPGGVTHYSAQNLVWLGDTALVYVAMYYSYWPGAIGVPPDTQSTGLEIVRLQLSGDTVVGRRVIANTTWVSSLASDTSGLYVTLGGDSRIYRLDLAAETLTPVYDFGALGIARDVQVRGGRILAVVGGRVTFAYNPSYFVFQQEDYGGPVWSAPLAGGDPVVVVDVVSSRYYRRLAVAPDGRHAVAEVLTGASEASDLWLIALP